MAGAHDDDPVLDQALDWLLAVENAPGDAALRAACEAWKAESEAHARAWRRAERTWRLTGELAKLPGPGHMPGPAPSPSRPPRHRVMPRWAAAAAAVLVAGLLALAGRDILLTAGTDYATGTAEVRSVALPDGSHLVLDARSAVAVHFTAAERRISLLAGSAFFDVRRDPSRPFVVTAGDASVTALGTAFALELGRDRLSTAVAEGRVHLDRPGEGIDIGAGEEIAITRSSGAALRRRLAPGDVAGWRDGRLVADNDPVADVVRKLADHHHGLILTLDGSLADQRVSGIYDLDRPVEALRALVRPFGGEVREITPYLILLVGA